MSNQVCGTTLILVFGCFCFLGGCDSHTAASKPDAQTGGSKNPAFASSPDACARAALASCTRDTLAATIESYFGALSAHDPSRLALAPQLKMTENGKTIDAGDGLWASAGELRFKRSALDTSSCSSVTEAVISEGGADIVFGLRLRLEAGKISEVESIVVRSGDYISSPAGLSATSDDDWETLLGTQAQPTRDELTAIVDAYFLRFPEGACGFADDCTRSENGLVTGACSLTESCGDAGTDAGSRGMMPRLYVLDVEASIAVGFTMFTGRTFPGTYTDFHMFKYRDGNVHAIHATLASADEPGWP